MIFQDSVYHRPVKLLLRPVVYSLNYLDDIYVIFIKVSDQFNLPQTK